MGHIEADTAQGKVDVLFLVLGRGYIMKFLNYVFHYTIDYELQQIIVRKMSPQMG
jgi:hypothetical protein